MTEETNFSEWLKDELEARGWKPAELSRRGAIDKAVVSRLLSAGRKPGPETCASIAQALELPEEDVFREAGLLPLKPLEPRGLSELVQIYTHACEEDRDDLLEYARFRRTQRQKIDLRQRLMEQLQQSRRG